MDRDRTECPFVDCHQMVRGHDATLFGSDGMEGVVGKQNENRHDLDILKERVITRRALWIFCFALIPCALGIIASFLLFWSDTRLVSKIVERNTGLIQENLRKDEAQETAIVQLKEQYIALDKSVSSLSRVMITNTREILDAIQQSKKGVVTDRGY